MISTRYRDSGVIRISPGLWDVNTIRISRSDRYQRCLALVLVFVYVCVQKPNGTTRDDVLVQTQRGRIRIRIEVNGRRRREWSGGVVELVEATISVSNGDERTRARKEANGMLDFEQQANQALASLDDDWHLLEGERTTFAIFFLPFPAPSSKARNTGRTMPHDAAQNSNPAEREGQLLGNVRVPYLRATNSKIPCCID
ncbi:hypothetical protein DMN91_006783 [Ooceraea biroi]|uniref:Uncharacterized protein n=1 Tax=Ooceraea biroi TaxID=2015173 RepID=A0A3L8DIM6_OOCBI|nr:hypothetical protein DMN91_006783 [Ooceraea biroi]